MNENEENANLEEAYWGIAKLHLSVFRRTDRNNLKCVAL
jgi:hypothetical protein